MKVIDNVQSFKQYKEEQEHHFDTPLLDNSAFYNQTVRRLVCIFKV